MAAKGTHAETMRSLLAAGADVNAVDFERGVTPLHLCCEEGDLEAVKVLLDADANVNAIDKDK